MIAYRRKIGYGRNDCYKELIFHRRNKAFMVRNVSTMKSIKFINFNVMTITFLGV